MADEGVEMTASAPDRKKGDHMTVLARLFAAALAAALLAAPADAADPVKIGALYPLTGSSAPAGQAAKAAIELGVDIVNNAHPELKGLPLADTAGLPNLGGAKITVIAVDHQGDPSIGQQQTLRLITQEHVAALLGVYHSSVALTATACLSSSATASPPTSRSADSNGPSASRRSPPTSPTPTPGS
jgi:branched-chain amino acid transport system substrate-binding protein